MEKAGLLRAPGRTGLLRDDGVLPRSGGPKEVADMAVENVGERYRCSICGNEVEVTAVGGGTLVCCGEDMELIE